jgi:U3 small nucleolar RNA-associated protein 23
MALTIAGAGDTNRHRYVIASQSQPLRSRLRAVPGVPIVHVNRSVMILEPPSDATLKVKEMVCAESPDINPDPQCLQNTLLY